MNACWMGCSGLATLQPFDRDDFGAVRARGVYHARHDSHIIEKDGTSAAFALGAALLGPGQLDLITQPMQQRFMLSGRRCRHRRRSPGSVIGLVRRMLENAEDSPRKRRCLHRRPIASAALQGCCLTIAPDCQLPQSALTTSAFTISLRYSALPRTSSMGLTDSLASPPALRRWHRRRSKACHSRILRQQERERLSPPRCPRRCARHGLTPVSSCVLTDDDGGIDDGYRLRPAQTQF